MALPHFSLLTPSIDTVHEAKMEHNCVDHRSLCNQGNMPMVQAQSVALTVLIALCSAEAVVSVTREQLWTGETSSFYAPNGSFGAPVHSASEAVYHGKTAIGPNRIQQATADPEESGFDNSGLTLEVAIAPLPRPAEVMTFRPAPRPATPAEIVRGAAIPPPPPSLRNASDLSCIAVAIYHEARDQEEFGQRAVASVILQRAAIPHRWGDSACENVVPTQFSFMTSRYEYPKIEDTDSWRKAVSIAAEVLVNGPLPELHGADHYHTTAVSPKWAPKMVRIRSIDDHIFYVDLYSYSAL
ncbi:hypothetical protein FHD68_11705 [Paracoccus marcusii]|nr:hypothetical protein FHD68_11705 [Paracoccus marcusii]